MKRLLSLLVACLFAATVYGQNVNGGGTSATSTSTVSKVVDDTTTNATVYPLWVTATSGNLPLKVSSSKITFNPSTAQLTDAGSVLVGATGTAATTLQVVDTGTATPRGITHDEYNTSTSSAQINTRKARGTFATPLTIVTGDILGRHLFWGHDGTNFIESANIRATSSGTIATSRVPSQLEFYTSTNAAPSVLTLGMTLNSSQSLTLAGNLTFGTSASILNGTTGSIGLTATGTNQTITLTPSGTGSVTVAGTPAGTWNGLQISATDASQTQFQISNSQGTSQLITGGTGATRLRNTSSSQAITFEQNAESARFAPTTGHLLLGGLTTDGTGVLQFPAAITSAGGITMGADWHFYRDAAGSATIDSATMNFHGAAAAANTVTQLVKAVTAIPDATATTVLTVTVPNAAHSAMVRVTLVGSLGAGGAIGANEASQTISYDLAVARTAGVAMNAVISSAYGSSGSVAVVGGATIAVTAAITLNAEGVSVSNTASIKVTITKGSGSSANHTCQVRAEIINANATGITLS